MIKNFDAIVNLMNDEIREQVHMELTPCSEEEFLKRYCELDPDAAAVIKSEFGIDVDLL